MDVVRQEEVRLDGAHPGDVLPPQLELQPGLTPLQRQGGQQVAQQGAEIIVTFERCEKVQISSVAELDVYPWNNGNRIP